MVWSLICVVAPEVVIYHAMVQFTRARQLRNSRNKLLDAQDIEVMPIVGRESDVSVSESRHGHCPLSKRKPAENSSRQWTMEHAYFAIMGGVCVDVRKEITVKNEKNEEYTTLTPQGLLLLARYDLLPDISVRTIRARNKTDYLAKTLICLQVTWMLIQTVARKFYDLPVSLLEINTLAQIGCALVIYSIWWYKPQGIEEPIYINLTDCDRCTQILKENDFNCKYVVAEAGNVGIIGKMDAWDEIGTTRNIIFLFLLGLIYSGAHATAWNSHFPTVIEQRMWQVSALILIAVVLFILIWSLVSVLKDGWLWDALQGIYILARCFLLVEAFISMRSLPKGTYSTPDWSSALPHIS
jgi:hypothetical protein